MSYDADDPDDILGPASAANRPGSKRSGGLVRGLTGDVAQVFATGQRVQLIDVEYDVPKVLMVSGRVLPTREHFNGGNSTLATWRIRTGIDRSLLVDEKTFGSGRFSLTVVARSLSVTAEASQLTLDPAGPLAYPHTIQAIAVPMDISCDVGDLSALSANPAYESPNSALLCTAAQTPLVGSKGNLDGLIDSSVVIDPTLYGRSYRRGFAVQNATAVDMFLLLGSFVSPANANAYTVKVVSGAYYEAPYGFSGAVDFWFASSGLGEAYFTVFGANTQV